MTPNDEHEGRGPHDPPGPPQRARARPRAAPGLPPRHKPEAALTARSPAALPTPPGSSAADLTSPSAQRGRGCQCQPDRAERSEPRSGTVDRPAARSYQRPTLPVPSIPPTPDRPMTDPETGCAIDARTSEKDSDTGRHDPQTPRPQEPSDHAALRRADRRHSRRRTPPLASPQDHPTRGDAELPAATVAWLPHGELREIDVTSRVAVAPIARQSAGRYAGPVARGTPIGDE